MAGEAVLVLLYASLAALAAIIFAGFRQGWFKSGRFSSTTVTPIPPPEPSAPASEPTAPPEVVVEAEAQTAQAYAALERVAEALQAQAAEINAAMQSAASITSVTGPINDTSAEAPQTEIAEVTPFAPPVTVYDPPFPAPSPIAEPASSRALQGEGTSTEVSEVNAAAPPIPVVASPARRARRASSPRTRKGRTRRTHT